jgi:phosphoesterase RecJ-like protein
MLVIEDMRLLDNNQLSVALKLYPDNKITAKIRANYGYPIAAELAQHFGGGGHKYASGFKTSDFSSVDEIRKELISKASELINNLEQKS